LTRALATADDDALAELVAERRALREELRAFSPDGDVPSRERPTSRGVEE
jgi:hypothetical protein